MAEITAHEALRDPFGVIPGLQRAVYQAPVVDLETCVIGGKRLNVDLAWAVIDAEIERTIDQGSTFTLTVADPDGNIRKSAIIAGDCDCSIDGFDYRLANVSKQGKQLVLQFEVLGQVLLKQKFGYKRAWRKTHQGGKGVTRAEFVLSLVREIKRPRIPVTIPDLHTIRPVGKFSASIKRKNTQRAPGVSTQNKLTIKGARINDQQAHNLDIAFDEANSLKASKRAIVAMVCSGIQESGWKDIMEGDQSSVEVFKAEGYSQHPGTNGYGGVLQGDVAVKRKVGHFYNMKPDKRTREQCHDFLEGGNGFQSGGAIQLAKDFHDWTPGQIAVAVEASGVGGGPYQQWHKEAEAIYKDWHSGRPGTTITFSRIKKYAFVRELDKSSWDTIQDLATEAVPIAGSAAQNAPTAEIGYAAFFVGNRFYFIAEQELLASRSIMTISEDSEGVDNIDYDYDRGHPVAEMTVTCRTRFWTAPPGSIVTVFDMGIQVDGRWLVSSISRRRFDLNTTIVLKKPVPLQPEPAPQVDTTSDQVPGATDTGGRSALGGIYHNANLGRIDQGIDFTGRGAVIALADGQITRAAPNDGSGPSGWPGGTMIVQKLDKPVKMGKRTYRFIYYAENIAVKCKRGQYVSAGDVIGFARGVSPFTEQGWANDAVGTTYARSHEGYSEGEQTASGIDFANWMGFGPKEGYTHGGGPQGTGHITYGEPN